MPTTDGYNGAYTGQQIDAAISSVSGKVNKSGDTMSGPLNMGGNRVTNVGAPVDETDAVRQSDLEVLSDEIDNIITGKTPVSVPVATETKAGIVKPGTGVTVEDDGTLNVSSQLPAGGTDGQILTKTADGVAWEDAPEGGVTSFNNRTGAITPQSGDYTAAMVGARPSTWTPTASEVGAIPATEKGAASGVATLGTDGKLTAAQKPAYTASEVGARPSTWTPSAADVGAVPTTRTINSKPLSSNITLTADDVGAGAPATSTTVTLTASGWTGSAAPFSQQVSCSIVAADTAVVAVDVDTPGTDADADAEAINAWALCTQQNPTQGAGTLTFYCTEKPTINIPVKVGVA